VLVNSEVEVQKVFQASIFFQAYIIESYLMTDAIGGQHLSQFFHLSLDSFDIAHTHIPYLVVHFPMNVLENECGSVVLLEGVDKFDQCLLIHIFNEMYLFVDNVTGLQMIFYDFSHLHQSPRPAVLVGNVEWIVVHHRKSYCSIGHLPTFNLSNNKTQKRKEYS